MMSPGPVGFDFSKYKGKRNDAQEKGAEEKKEEEERAPRKRKDDMLAISLVSLISEALPYLRKFASNRANWNGTKQGEECQKVVEKIDAKLKSMNG